MKNKKASCVSVPITLFLKILFGHTSLKSAGEMAKRIKAWACPLLQRSLAFKGSDTDSWTGLIIRHDTSPRSSSLAWSWITGPSGEALTNPLTGIWLVEGSAVGPRAGGMEIWIWEIRWDGCLYFFEDLCFSINGFPRAGFTHSSAGGCWSFLQVFFDQGCKVNSLEHFTLMIARAR